MKNSFVNLVVGATISVASTVMLSGTAQAGSLTNASIGGTSPTDYYVYGVSGNNTVKINNPTVVDLQNALDGNSASPTGNVELRASSELSGFDFSKNTTLSGKIGGQDITLSSLTAADWFTTTSQTFNTTYGANNLATKWFNTFLTQAGKGSFVGTANGAVAYNTFIQIKGFERTSDPNISYVNQDDNTGLITIGLAGHYDLKAAYSQPNSPFAPIVSLLPNGFQASEVVKYNYNGNTGYLYSFNATQSGLTDVADGISHNGNYEVTINGVPPVKTPEPSMMMGLFGVIGMVALRGKFKKISA